MKKNDRLQALKILSTLLQKNNPLTALMQSLPDLSPFSKELCFGVCRHYFRLSALADCLVKKRPKEMEVWLGLLIGLYQLHFLKTPDYAVVKETVALMDQVKKPWAKGLINGVLRSFIRKQETLLMSLRDNPPFNHGHPDWLQKRIQRVWPSHWEQILKANDTHPPMTLRVNAQRTTREEYIDRLQQMGIEAHPTSFSPQGIALANPCDVHDLPGFTSGDVSVQDEAAQLAISLLDLKPGHRWLDACCAPGGKTCHGLETEPLLSTCIALDLDQKRLQRVQENLTRLNLQATLIAGDALNPETWWDGRLFDRILLDAPCSATGVIRRHPDIKLLRTEKDIETIVTLQNALLQSIWPLLAPDGIMVYATCSIMPEENEEQIINFISNHPDAHVAQREVAWGHATGHGWQIFPGDHGMDGFFYSVLKK